jgi:hypothetical protein
VSIVEQIEQSIADAEKRQRGVLSGAFARGLSLPIEEAVARENAAMGELLASEQPFDSARFASYSDLR